MDVGRLSRQHQRQVVAWRNAACATLLCGGDLIEEGLMLIFRFNQVRNKSF